MVKDSPLQNPLLNEYRINRDVAGLITLLKKNKECEYDFYAEMTYDITKESIEDAHMCEFVKLGDDMGSMSGKYVHFTETNGFDSISILEDDKIPSEIIDGELKLDTPYLYIDICQNDETETKHKPIYVELGVIDNLDSNSDTEDFNPSVLDDIDHVFDTNVEYEYQKKD